MAEREQHLKVVESQKGQSHTHKGKTAVVTGAGRGIGRALTTELLSRGYTVVAVVRSLAHVQELFELDPSNLLPLRCDVTEPSTETVLKEFLSTRVEKIDLLINNAGHGASKYGVAGMCYDEFTRVLDVHCVGPIRCVRACLPHLRQSETATIINMSSRFASLEWVATRVVPAAEATYPYRIAKAALNMFTACLAAELADENINVISIDPGKVKTRFGPKDADTEPAEAASNILDLVERGCGSGVFVNSTGGKLPW